MSFLDKLFLSGVAAALKTPTGQLDVSGSTPVVGRVLKVLDADHAGWEAEAGGGGGGEWVAEPHIVVAPSFTGVANNAYLCVGGACEFTLPDATLPENVGRTIEVAFFARHNTITTLDLESPNILFDAGGNAFGTELTDVPASAWSFQCIYDPGLSPAGFWIVHRYAPGSPAALPPTRRCQIDFVYYGNELPSPYDTISQTDGDILQGSDLSVGPLLRDFVGAYGEGQLVLFPFLTGPRGLYRVIRDNGGTDWAFKFVEGPDSDDDPNGDLTYYVKNGDAWGGREWLARVNNVQFYAPVRAPLDVFPWNGDVLGTGENTGIVYDNTNQIVIGRVNLLKTAGPYHDFTLVEGDLSVIIGERFAIKCVQFTGIQSFNVHVANLIEGVDGLIGSTATFDLQLGTYIEWQLMPDLTWHLVSWWPGNTGG